MTNAHQVTERFAILCTYPDHEPRESDSHYAVFNQTRDRLKRLGKLVCWVGNADCAGGIELHHSAVEYSLLNVVDVAKFTLLHPDFHIANDEDFLNAVESEGGLLPLCVRHHRGDLGIHCTTYPGWSVQKVMKDGTNPPEKRVTSS